MSQLVHPFRRGAACVNSDEAFVCAERDCSSFRCPMPVVTGVVAPELDPRRVGSSATAAACAGTPPGAGTGDMPWFSLQDLSEHFPSVRTSIVLPRRAVRSARAGLFSACGVGAGGVASRSAARMDGCPPATSLSAPCVAASAASALALSGTGDCLMPSLFLGSDCSACCPVSAERDCAPPPPAPSTSGISCATEAAASYS